MLDDTLRSELEALPDYPMIERLASVLWGDDNSFHGAAVMVGAGFSRASATTGDRTKRLPLWFHFSDALASALGIKVNDPLRGAPLRIAEQYAAYFGRQALDDLIKKEINDSIWKPGELHHSLLRLPWTEVLTTNWDSLLERSSEAIHERFYSVVHRQEDLSNARAPRIIKLHGTVNVTENLTFTQEDYRSFPTTNAAFVNFARQVFIENELCLIGFSGDDPNFLQWAGWVRDHLSTNARRIYLVGALDLSSANRKYLESINIAPIDLSKLVEDYDNQDLKHARVTDIFFSSLEELKPKKTWEWDAPRTSRDAPIEETLSALHDARCSYPGWLICPAHLRFRVHSAIDNLSINKAILKQLNLVQKARLLYEVSWYYNVSFKPVSEWLAEEMLSAVSPECSNALTKKQQMEIALYVLKVSRWFDEGDSFEEAVAQLIKKNQKHWPDAKGIMDFHQVAKARSDFDYHRMEELADSLPEDTIDKKLRKVSVLGELGRFDEGKAILSEARRHLLNSFREQQHSVYLVSRLSVVNSLLKTIDYQLPETQALNSMIKEAHCDFWEQIEAVKVSAQDELNRQKSQQGIEVLFEAGRFVDKSGYTYVSNEVHPFIMFDELLNGVGIPMRWERFNYLRGIAETLYQLTELTLENRFFLAVCAANKEDATSLNKAVSRIQLTQIPEVQCMEMTNRYEHAIDFWVKKTHSSSISSSTLALTNIRIFIEVLARLSVRVNELEAKRLFKYAVQLGSKESFQHHWLRNSLSHLIEYSLESVPENAQEEILLDYLLFPLISELQSDRQDAVFKWPNPVLRNPTFERQENHEVDDRIHQLINAVAPSKPACASALERLLPLVSSGYLKQHEYDKLCKQLWGLSGDSPRELPETGLLSWVLLELPSHHPAEVKRLFREYVFDSKSIGHFKSDHLLDLRNCIHVDVKPSSREAYKLFEVLTHRLLTDKRKAKAFNLVDQKTTVIAAVLNEVVVPAMDSADMNVSNYIRLKDFIVTNSASQALKSLVSFVGHFDNAEIELEKMIRQHFYSGEKSDCAHSVAAIIEWNKKHPSERSSEWLALIVEMITVSCDVKVFYSLQGVSDALEAKLLNQSHIKRVRDVLPSIFAVSNYEAHIQPDNEIPHLSLLRAQVAKIAKRLVAISHEDENEELEEIIAEAKADPLPEVRFS